MTVVNSQSPIRGGRLKYNGVLPGAPRESLTALLSPHAALGMMPYTLAWVDHCPNYLPTDVTPFCDGDVRGWFLEGISNVIALTFKCHCRCEDGKL
jgi:hypothetical protein